MHPLLFRAIVSLSLAAAAALPAALLGWWMASSVENREMATAQEKQSQIANAVVFGLERYAEDVLAIFDQVEMSAIAGLDGRDPARVQPVIDFARNVGALYWGRIDPSRPEPSQIQVIRGAVAPLTAETMVHLAAQATPTTSFTSVTRDAAGQIVFFVLRREPDGSTAALALGTDQARRLTARVRFGTHGHSVVVDREGNVISHPRTEWERELRNLSAIPPVQALIQGHSGFTQFNSPARNEDMVAAYAVARTTGWGVMIVRPLSEIGGPSGEFARLMIGVVLGGMVIAGLFGWGIAGILLRHDRFRTRITTGMAAPVASPAPRSR